MLNTADKKALAKYLDRSAETEVKHFANWPAHLHYQHCLIIPAYDENPDFIERLLQQPWKNTLVIVVINQPQNSPVCDNNIRLFDYFADLPQQWISHNCCLYQTHFGGILVVDRFTPSRQIPPKQGVGLARKIGADIACQLFYSGFLTGHWIGSTDADASLPADYFTRLPTTRDFSLAVFPFCHIGEDNNVTQATQAYEQAMHYYRDALIWSGSPYGYHTIGSCLAFSLLQYAKAHGFPKRAAGEDFYLLNKLAKLGKVKYCEGQPINISARLSNRVPFGTGPAVEKIMTTWDEGKTYEYYHPEIFPHLKQWLQHIENYWQHRDDIENWLASLSRPAQHALEQLGITELLEHIQKQASDQQQAVNYFHQWFDAFRTLKFIHFLRDSYYPNLPLETCLACWEKIKDDNTHPTA